MTPTPAPPPVVVTGKKVSLADHLDLRNLPLATTPGGSNFAMKALHPSEHTIKAARVPGGNRMSVAVCSDAVMTFQVGEDNEFFQIFNSPDILCPATLHRHSKTGVSNYYGFLNAAFGGNVKPNPTNAQYMALLTDNLLGKVTAYRITSQSVTAELIAPALSDQGTVTACQREIRPKTMSWVDSSSAAAMRLYNDVDYYHVPPTDPATMVLGTSAYTAQARDGCYQPLKLTDFSWQTFLDPAIVVNTDSARISDSSAYQPVRWFNVGADATPETRMFPVIPHFEDRSEATSWDHVYPTPKTCGYNFGIIRFEGLSPNASVRVRVRQVIEIIAPPATLYAPMLETALPPDDTAIRMYFEVSSRMADAYPASYNDLGKLKDIVKRIASGVFKYAEPALSVLSSVPGPVGTVAGGLQTATALGRQLYEGLSKKNRKKIKAAST